MLIALGHTRIGRTHSGFSAEWNLHQSVQILFHGPKAARCWGSLADCSRFSTQIFLESSAAIFGGVVGLFYAQKLFWPNFLIVLLHFCNHWPFRRAVCLYRPRKPKPPHPPPELSDLLSASHYFLPSYIKVGVTRRPEDHNVTSNVSGCRMHQRVRNATVAKNPFSVAGRLSP